MGFRALLVPPIRGLVELRCLEMQYVTYGLEEQEIAILNSVRCETLQELTTRVYSIIPFLSKEAQWFRVDCVSILDNILGNGGVDPKFVRKIILYGFDCFDQFHDLKSGDQISLLEDVAVILSNGQTPIAVVKGRGGITFV